MSHFKGEHEKIWELVSRNMAHVTWQLKCLERELKQRNEDLSEDILLDLYRLAGEAFSLEENAVEIEMKLVKIKVCNGKN